MEIGNLNLLDVIKKLDAEYKADKYNKLNESNDELIRAFWRFIESAAELLCIIDEEEEKAEDKEEELNRCPMCGSSVHVAQEKDGKWFITCGFCPLETTAEFDTKEEAVRYWNG